MGVLARAWADGPGVGDGEASGARATGVAAGEGLVGDFGVRV